MEFALASRTGGVPRVLDRRISNAGRLHDIRKRDPQQIFTTGGIPRYSTLGSQNAISYVPIAYPSKSAGTQTDSGTGTETGAGGGGEQKKPILPGMTKKDTGTGTGLLGTTQSESSKTTMAIRKLMEEEKAKEQAAKKKEEEAKTSAVEPGEKPPFDLSSPEGKKAMEDYSTYVTERYGGDAGRLKADEIKIDSEGFTVALQAWRQINKEMNAFNKDDKRRWSQWASNTFKEYGDDIAKALAFGSNILYPGSKKIIDDIYNEVKKFKPTDEKDFVGSMQQLQAKLFEGRPEWKNKLNQIITISFNKFMEKWRSFPGISMGEEDFAGLKPKKKKNSLAI